MRLRTDFTGTPWRRGEVLYLARHLGDGYVSIGAALGRSANSVRGFALRRGIRLVAKGGGALRESGC